MSSIKELKKIVEIQQNTLSQMKPVINRLNEIFKPDGKFDKIIECVHSNSIKVNSHNNQIRWLWAIVTGTIITLIIALVTLIK